MQTNHFSCYFILSAYFFFYSVIPHVGMRIFYSTYGMCGHRRATRVWDELNWCDRRGNRCKRVCSPQRNSKKIYYSFVINIKCLLFKVKKLIRIKQKKRTQTMAEMRRIYIQNSYLMFFVVSPFVLALDWSRWMNDGEKRKQLLVDGWCVSFIVISYFILIET